VVGTVLSCGYMMISLPVVTWIRFVAWLALGFVVYFAYGVKHSILGKGASVTPDTP
jgi:APA family basic amino acid/polyamine antiporter